MTLNDLFKNTNYDDTLFSDEAKHAIESAVYLRPGKGGEVPYINCLQRNKGIKLTPEEAVRQLYLYKLIHEYGYPTSRIEVEYPIHFGREVKRADIAIMDKDRPMVPYNLIRFYYAYVYPNKSALQMIGARTFFEQIVSPTLLSEFVPHRFEELCRSFFSQLAKSGRLPGITNIGTYYYDDPARRRNGEFDVALAFGDEYEIYESKYYRNPMTLDEIHREAGQAREIDALKVVRLGFIAANGFAKQEDGYTYYSGEELYEL